MNVRSIVLFAAAAVLSTPALAARAPKGTITFKPKKAITEGRPTPIRAQLTTRSTDLNLLLEFDSVAYGAGCGIRCARATFLIDTDADTSTGLQQGSGKPPTGADLSVVVEGLEDFSEGKASPYVRVAVRQFKDEDRTIEDGDVVATYDHRKDHGRVKLDGKKMTIVLDVSSEAIPTGKATRLVYLAPGTRPLSTRGPAIKRDEPRTSARAESGSRSGGGVVIERGPRRRSRSSGPVKTEAAARARAREQAMETNGTTGPIHRSGGSAYDPNSAHEGGEGG